MMQEIQVLKYRSFDEISKENPEMKYENINPNNVMNVFYSIFCNKRFRGRPQAPMWVNLSELKEAVCAPKNQRQKETFLDVSTNATRYGASVSQLEKLYMPLLLVRQNPNKLLELVLNIRKACLGGQKLDNLTRGAQPLDINSDITNPLDQFYIGLEQVAQFLNFCVMLRQIPTKEGQEIKDINQSEKLSFDKSVLKEFTDQYKREKTLVEQTIGEGNIEKYKTKLKDLRAKYDNYCRAMINKKDGGSYDECISFTEWISKSGNFVEKAIREHDGGPLIGVYNDGLNKDKVIDGKNVDKETVKQGYHAGGGIEDKNELTKLLKLDAVLQARNAINQFIDTNAVDESTLGWFQELWNSIVQGTWIANKLGWFFKEKGSIKLKSNQFIPRLYEHENKETALNKTTEKNLDDIY